MKPLKILEQNREAKGRILLSTHVENGRPALEWQTKICKEQFWDFVATQLIETSLKENYIIIPQVLKDFGNIEACGSDFFNDFKHIFKEICSVNYSKSFHI